MPIERLNESIARSRAFDKSIHATRERASYEAKAHAVDIPLKKSAVEDKTTVLTSFRVMAIV